MHINYLLIDKNKYVHIFVKLIHIFRGILWYE